MTIHMGWIYSPPFFFACTEKVVNMANQDLNDKNVIVATCSTPHELDVVLESFPETVINDNNNDNNLNLDIVTSIKPLDIVTSIIPVFINNNLDLLIGGPRN